MNKSTKNKLLHFYTDGGNIPEDFSESRSKKTAKFRRVIRVCFYAHCAAAVICIALAAILRAGWGIAAVAVCEVILTTLAFLAVGDMTLMKTLLYCGDLAFAAAMFVTGVISGNGAPFFAVGAVSVVVAVIAVVAYFSAQYKAFLDGFSPLAIRREHYTLLPNFSYDVPVEPPADKSKEKALPPKSEFQLLADKLKEVFNEPKNAKAPEERQPSRSSNTQSHTEVTQ